MDTKATYRAAWADFSKRNRFFFGSIYGGGALVMLITVLFPSTTSGPVWIVLLALWIGAAVGTNIYRHMFPCPRCGNRFLGWGVGWPERCGTCRLPRGEDV